MSLNTLSLVIFFLFSFHPIQYWSLNQYFPLRHSIPVHVRDPMISTGNLEADAHIGSQNTQSSGYLLAVKGGGAVQRTGSLGDSHFVRRPPPCPYYRETREGWLRSYFEIMLTQLAFNQPPNVRGSVTKWNEERTSLWSMLPQIDPLIIVKIASIRCE